MLPDISILQLSLFDKIERGKLFDPMYMEHTMCAQSLFEKVVHFRK